MYMIGLECRRMEEEEGRERVGGWEARRIGGPGGGG